MTARMLTRTVASCPVCQHRTGRWCPFRPERGERRRARKVEKRAWTREAVRETA